jgi:hypothetical protein
MRQGRRVVPHHIGSAGGSKTRPYSLSGVAGACFLTGLLTCLLACAKPRPGDQDATPALPVIVTVANNGYLDADVFAVAPGVRYHLGFVPSAAKANFLVPPTALYNGDLRLFVIRVGGRNYYTSTLQMPSGGHAFLDLESQPSLSTFTTIDPDPSS